MTDELIDICDENNKITKMQKMKSEAHKNGFWHRAAHIWIYNAKGEILLQLRTKNKSLYPDLWDLSVAGHVGASEKPVVSAVREIKEEIGLTIDEEELQFCNVKKVSIEIGEIKNNEFYYVYLFKFDGDIKKLKLQESEVQEVRFMPISKILRELQKNPKEYVPRGEYWFDIIDEIEKRST